MLNGYKTYIVGALLVLGAVGSYLSGDATTAMLLLGMAGTSLGLRDAIKKVE